MNTMTNKFVQKLKNTIVLRFLLFGLVVNPVCYTNFFFVHLFETNC